MTDLRTVCNEAVEYLDRAAFDLANCGQDDRARLYADRVQQIRSQLAPSQQAAPTAE